VVIALGWTLGFLGIFALFWFVDLWSCRRSERRQLEHRALRSAWQIHDIVTTARRRMVEEAGDRRSPP